jgi:hypothetical protein
MPVTYSFNLLNLIMHNQAKPVRLVAKVTRRNIIHAIDAIFRGARGFTPKEMSKLWVTYQGFIIAESV